MKDKKREVFLPRYNFTCPNCMYEQSADTSLAMRMGHNRGHGSCMNCGVFLHLEITPDLSGDTMKATRWEVFSFVEDILPNLKDKEIVIRRL